MHCNFHSQSSCRAVMTGSLFSVIPSKCVEFSLVQGVLSAEIEILNESEDRIGYRVMTNTRDDYVVHPSSGFVPRGESVVCTLQLKRDGNVDNHHAFIVSAHPASSEDLDRKVFWEKLKDTAVSLHKVGIKYPKMNERAILERLTQQVRTLKTEIRSARITIDKQNKLISELRNTVVPCHHPSFIVVFILACASITVVLVLANLGMRESLYIDAIHPLL